MIYVHYETSLKMIKWHSEADWST